jgi:hypothetical protein
MPVGCELTKCWVLWVNNSRSSASSSRFAAVAIAVVLYGKAISAFPNISMLWPRSGARFRTAAPVYQHLISLSTSAAYCPSEALTMQKWRLRCSLIWSGIHLPLVAFSCQWACCAKLVGACLSESTLSLTAGAQSPFILDIERSACLLLYDLITTPTLPASSCAPWSTR